MSLYCLHEKLFDYNYTPHSILPTVQDNIWKVCTCCVLLLQNEEACNELTTRGTTIFKSLSNCLHLLIKGSTTHQDTFTFDLIWSRKSPY